MKTRSFFMAIVLVVLLACGIAHAAEFVNGEEQGSGSATVSDTAYNATSWDANTDAASKNSIRDKIETMGGGAPSGAQYYTNQADGTLSAEIVINMLQQSDCSGITAGMCLDSDNGYLYSWDGDSVELVGVLNYQPLESTLTDMADGTIAEDLVNTANPWADNEVADDITITNISQVGDITATALEINTPLDGALVQLTEFRELETIGATTISANQWAAIGGMSETLTSSELNYLDAVTAALYHVGDEDTIAAAISAGAYTDDSVQAADIDTINCGTNCTWDATNDEIDVDDAFLVNDAADEAGGTIGFPDEAGVQYGTNDDWTVLYDEDVDDQLLFYTNQTTATADTDPLFEILVDADTANGTGMDADQEVFGISKGTQASNVNLFNVDEDGDGYFAGTVTAAGIVTAATADPKLIMRDSDAADGDDNFEIDVDATATGTGAEDIDVDIKAQIAGTATRFIYLDADHASTLDHSYDSALQLGNTTVFAAPRLYTASYTTQTLVADECWNSTIYFTGAGTITLPAVQTGMKVTFVTHAAAACHVDTNASDRMYLDGTALDDGDKASSQSTAGEAITCTYESAAGWSCLSDGWTDGGA